MGWAKTRVNGEDRIEGSIGDKLGLHITATVDGFDGHTWLAQIRLRSDANLFLQFDLIEDNSSPTAIDLLFEIETTDMFVNGKEYFIGVKAIAGTYAPYTLIPALPVVGYDVIAHEEPP